MSSLANASLHWPVLMAKLDLGMINGGNGNMDRRDSLLALVDCDEECGLEIGPLDKAIVVRKPGRRIFYCDYARREDLQSRSSSDPNVDIDNIPDIDFVASRITGETFGSRRFDYVIASHVIEHIPDVISWLNHLLKALNEGGRLVLAVPDRRYTFDYLRPISTAGQLIEAYLEQRSRPAPSQVYDGFSMAVATTSVELWDNPPTSTAMRRLYSRQQAFRLANKVFADGNYQDCHCWVFTHESFLNIIEELNALGVLSTRVIAHSAPSRHANEFHVVLGMPSAVDSLARYEGHIVYQAPSGRGKDDGWYLVRDGLRHWISDPAWLGENGYEGVEPIQIPDAHWHAIPEGAILRAETSGGSG